MYTVTFRAPISGEILLSYNYKIETKSFAISPSIGKKIGLPIVVWNLNFKQNKQRGSRFSPRLVTQYSFPRYTINYCG